ncbi:hypothetical protein HAX54_041620 [Datura stramonium]|uniref:Uncharacterized protein n=1 Tax=Datura stramonium TaxID=4076 RepID=A0ABS8W1S0_DATST|nr:hypothetical protein [Datura stramonium]
MPSILEDTYVELQLEINNLGTRLSATGSKIEQLEVTIESQYSVSKEMFRGLSWILYEKEETMRLCWQLVEAGIFKEPEKSWSIVKSLVNLLWEFIKGVSDLLEALKIVEEQVNDME